MSTSEYLGKTVILKTNMGDITLGFYPEDAPKAVENFIKLAEKGYYNGVTFHRVIKDFMIQGGDPTGTGAGGESIFGGAFEDELNPETASYKTGYQKGVLAMANSGPNTNGSQFFIILKNNPLNNLYTIFGRVEKGQEVVDQIGLVAVDSNDRPLEDVVIEAVIIR
ncbi:MAG: peptidylprolyl isomerase [Candidatus Doudnabacteria bacterium CG10_big_fil_rev_8_21_14_0_10_41_10]|uniref:Peptidyl-prolyl cis-trans isomerase n=1 Tax=Candidatus Doudnabacteria bacterium CG10_big_fil_rev_8_21_14_0_10_41_10 TaxID=1974551 RepID=A0A2H0VEU8_9BACT|nr:MAG: peptidylprolyl isomerase [Candidatus Doudnabacteria bacterium CG10_big_fil_rev_8_21_14_0_10_41_10]